MYTQLTREQRYQIKALLSMGHTQADIARAVGVHRSTISRELRRNRGQRGYHAKQAHEKALARRRGKSKPRIGPKVWRVVERRLREEWSPEQISGRLKLEGIFISHERIYQYGLRNKLSVK